jgi:hypothetical protein
MKNISDGVYLVIKQPDTSKILVQKLTHGILPQQAVKLKVAIL